jgi:hypothetical protein
MIRCAILAVPVLTLWFLPLCNALAEENAAFEYVNGYPVVPGRLLIEMAPDREVAVSAELDNRDFDLKHRFHIIRAQLWKYPKDQSVSETMAAVRQIPGVVGVWPDAVLSLCDSGQGTSTKTRKSTSST